MADDADKTSIKIPRDGGTHAEEALLAAVVPLSEASTWSEAQKEWRLTGTTDLLYPSPDHACACGTTPLRYLSDISNVHNGNSISPIGSSCVWEHFPGLRQRLAAMQEVHRLRAVVVDGGEIYLKGGPAGHVLSRGVLKLLLERDVLSSLGYATLLRGFNKTSPMSWKHMRDVERIVREVITPALGGDIVDIRESELFQMGLSDGLHSRSQKDLRTTYQIGYRQGHPRDRCPMEASVEGDLR